VATLQVLGGQGDVQARLMELQVSPPAPPGFPPAPALPLRHTCSLVSLSLSISLLSSPQSPLSLARSYFGRRPAISAGPRRPAESDLEPRFVPGSASLLSESVSPSRSVRV
jgi:hypothetical protein